MAVLLTGFDPFGGAESNPSWEAVCRVPEEIAGHRVEKVQLPTVFTMAAELLRREIARIRPEIVICCGVANGRTGLTPELVAINYRHARIPDNAGQTFLDQPIDPDGPAAYMTRLPVHGMIAAMQAAGIPASLSLSAGAYVCNDVYYALLGCEEAYGHRGLFLHVPGTEVADAQTAARGIALCAETALTFVSAGKKADANPPGHA